MVPGLSTGFIIAQPGLSDK